MGRAVDWEGTGNEWRLEVQGETVEERRKVGWKLEQGEEEEKSAVGK